MSPGHLYLATCLLAATFFSVALASDKRDGQPIAGDAVSIVPDAGPAARFAADELSRYLKTMTRQTYRVVKEAQPGPKSAVCLRVDESLHADGYRVESAGERVHITGGSSRGCLYGSYAWLHALGCRWSLPGDEYESVPRLQTLTWSGPTIEAQPAIRRRGMVYCIEDPNDKTCLELVDFLAKNGFSYLFLHVANLSAQTRQQLAAALNEREMGFEAGGHLLPSLLPRELFEKHPDCFRMDSGQRVSNLNMCPSSPQAAEIIAKNAHDRHLAGYEKDFARFETLHLWPDDLFGGGWCSCPRCDALSESDQALLILNEVAKRLPAGQAMLGHCAYHSAIKPPAKTVGHERVRLLYAPRERSYLQPLGTCKANRWYHDCLEGLVKAVPNEPEVFEYYHDMILFRFLPMPLHRIIGRDVEVYKAAGIDGIASLSFQGYDRWAYGPNSYVLGRALWRGRGSPDDIRDYCRDIYGPGGSAMEAYFDLLFELCATAMDTCDYDGFIDLRVPPPNQPGTKSHQARLEPLVADAHLDKIEACLDVALRSAGEPYRSRVWQQCLLWRFARQETRTIYKEIAIVPQVTAAMQPDATAEQRAKVIALVEEILRDIETGNEILRAIPEDLKGTFAKEDNGAFNERKTSYKHHLNQWLGQLKAAKE